VSPSKKANNQTLTKSPQGKSKNATAGSSRVRPQKESTQPEVKEQPKRSSLFINALRILALLIAVAITLYIYSIRDRVDDFAAFGYPGIFLIALFANATILLPAPGLAIVYAMGAVFNPVGVGLAAGTGGAIGELSGYLAGFSGQAVIERMDIYDRITPWVRKYGGWAILALSAIPNPFFDVVGIAAGVAKMPLRTFLFFAWIGQLIKMTVVGFAGKYSIELLSNFIG
jgi:membrane protein YqaA with SNARE-associated domain